MKNNMKLKITNQQAEELKSIMQNPLFNQSPDEEPKTQKELRKSIFNQITNKLPKTITININDELEEFLFDTPIGSNTQITI